MTATLRRRVARLSEQKRRFLEGFSWIAAFFVAARGASVITQFLAARLLGPEEFGRAHLVIAVASVVQVLPMLGFPFALARSMGGHPEDPRRPAYIASALTAFLGWGALSVLGLFASGPALVSTTGVTPALWSLCLTLAAATAVHLTLGGALQGLGRFRQRGTAEAVYALSALGLLAAAMASGRADAPTLVLCLVVGLCLASAYSLWALRDGLAAPRHLAPLRELLPFATLGTVIVVSAALIQAPGRIILFHLDSARAAGVYSAYFTATIQVSLSLGNMVQAVLIPLASRHEGQDEAWDLLERWGLRVAAALPLAFAALSSVAMAVLGRSYPHSWSWTALFSLAATAVLAHSLLAALFAARDLKGLFISIAGSLAAGVANLLLTLSLAPSLGVAGAAIGLAVGHAAGVALYLANAPRRAPRAR
ncbi:hypothetical protein EPO15_16315 [bacterium]|nr:MAG: hypothetical protein EPO15_16315 [bacterium]